MIALEHLTQVSALDETAVNDNQWAEIRSHKIGWVLQQFNRLAPAAERQN
jgi:hypothetical protein